MDDQILLPAEDKNLREPYREYFITKRKNYLAVVRDLTELWDCFLQLDAIWAQPRQYADCNAERKASAPGSCFDCFQDRLKLDSELIDMRAKLARCMKDAAWVINNQILTA